MYRKFAVAVLIIAPIIVMGVQSLLPAAKPTVQQGAPTTVPSEATPSTATPAPSAPPGAFAPPPDPSDFSKPMPGAGQPSGQPAVPPVEQANAEPPSPIDPPANMPDGPT